MTRLADNVIRLSGLPQRCSACSNQQPGIRHVDFDAACDRGYGNEEAVKVAYDDLILCENCVKEGLQVLGIEDSKELKAELQDTKRKLEIKDKLLKQAQRYSDTMEEALGHRPDPVHIDHRKRPRKELVDA
jgi:hypothetical protein